MKTFKVSTGSMRSRKVQAKNHIDAAVKALKEYPPKRLGLLIEITGSDSVPMYIDPVHVAKKAGYEVALKKDG